MKKVQNAASGCGRHVGYCGHGGCGGGGGGGGGAARGPACGDGSGYCNGNPPSDRDTARLFTSFQYAYFTFIIMHAAAFLYCSSSS